VYKLTINDFNKAYEALGCDKTGIKILSKKSQINTILIKNLHVGAANILKQDALSIGADLAVPMGVIVARDKYVNAILIATNKQLEVLSQKELAQPFGLKQIAKELKKFIFPPQESTKIMGIINANEDSFYQNSRFNGQEAVLRIEQLINDGASIIDLGAVSSRPGSIAVPPKEELNRIKPILDAIKKEKLYEKTAFSLDSYEPIVLKYALDCGFTIINDITGLQNDEVAKLGGEYKAKVVIMHMQNNPLTMQQEPFYEDVIAEIHSFFEERINKAKSFGIEDIILDVGIGFGKTLQHNLTLLKHHEHFRCFGYELLIGASRKSMINAIVPSTTQERLPGTLAIHLETIKRGASIVRCHDVKEHFQAIKVQEAILNS
jgi:dihydropteroate synthase